MDSAKKKIIKEISKILLEHGCSLAVIFGSFVTRQQYRDIDIMVAMKGGRPPEPEETLYLAQLIEKAIGKPCDIISINAPNVLLQAEIARNGIPIILQNKDLWEEFRWRAWIDEKDFRPLIEKFYEKRFGIKQRQNT